MPARFDCQLSDCNDPHHSHGYCAKHWFELPPRSRAFVALFDVPQVAPTIGGDVFMSAVRRAA